LASPSRPNLGQAFPGTATQTIFEPSEPLGQWAGFYLKPTSINELWLVLPSPCLAKTGAILALFAAATVAPASAATIVAWDFEGLQNLPKTGQQYFATPSEGMGKMKLVHNSTTTTFSDVVGNGNPSALGSNEWTVADYYDFDTATTGFKDIRIKWSQTSSNAGPAKFALFAKNFGGPALKLQDYTVGNASWSSSGVSASSKYSFDLSSIPALNNQAIVTFSLVLMGPERADGEPGTILSAGTNRIDDMVIEGVPLPPPVPGPLPLLGAVAAFTTSRRIRRRCRL
jgi:hypothetical protein